MSRFLFAPLLAFIFAHPVPAETDSLEVAPSTGVAGQFGSWTVTYRVGPEGISQGGGLRVQLPDSWHAGERNSAKPLQASDPKRDHYVSARTSRPGVSLRTSVEGETDAWLVKSARPSLDGRLERYVFVVRVVVESGGLEEGDLIHVLYGDRSEGSRGMQAAIISTPPEPILAAVDPAGDEAWRLLPEGPKIQAVSGSPQELILVAPSQALTGQSLLLNLALLDAHANPVPSGRESIRLQILQGDAEAPESLSVDFEQGWGSAALIPRREGILRVSATARDGLLSAVSNPVRVVDSMPERRVLWGDIHSHGEYSWDGVGKTAYEYARNVSGLDFYALTDHSRSMQEGKTRGLGAPVWSDYKALAEEHYEPGRFVTLHAYEISFGAPYGHHNVYFRSEPGRLIPAEESTLPALWEALTKGEALTIPHHTGKFPSPLRWDIHDPELRRNIEIYSAHGLSEAYDPSHPLAFEQSDFTSPARSVLLPQFVQDAWIEGLELSAVASSDDHRAQPGKPHWGLAAVLAEESTRESVFDALYERRTYATTGTRTLLEFSVDGAPMGQRIRSSGAPELRFEAHGQSPIEQVEILRYSPSEGGFKVIFTIRPNALDFEWSSRDPGFREDSIYYLRLRERSWIRGRPSMAWSSPVWVESSTP